MVLPKKQINQEIQLKTIARTSDGIRRRIIPKKTPAAWAAKIIPEKKTEAIVLRKNYPEEGVIIQNEPTPEESIVAEKPDRRSSEKTSFRATEKEKAESFGPKRLGRNVSILHSGGKNKKIILGASALTAVLLLVLSSTVFARLTLTLKPKTEILTLKDIEMTLDASVSQIAAEKKTIPAEKMEFSKKISRQFRSTGKKFVEDQARGRVKIYNYFSSSPQKLVASTRFLTDSGALYRLTSTVTVPGAEIQEGKIIPKFAEAELGADQAGENYNTGAKTILKIPGFKGSPKYDTFYAVADVGFSGGFRGDATVISKEDLGKAQEEVTKAVYDELKSESVKKIPRDLKLVDGLREIRITKVAAPKENTKADTFSVEAEAESRLLIFREMDGITLLKGLILKEGLKKRFLEESADFKYTAKNSDFEKGKATVAIEGVIKSQAVLSVGEVAEAVRGRKAGSISELLRARPELADFHISFFPPWVSSAPENPNKIKVVDMSVLKD